MNKHWKKTQGLGLLTGLCAVAVSGCQGDPGANGQAVEVVTRLRSHALRSVHGTESRPVLPPSEVERVTPVEGGFTAVAHKRSSLSTERPARVVLPDVAQRPFHLEDPTSGMTLEVSLDGASPVKADVVDGYVVYSDAYREGADVLHRFTPEGTEDYLLFERAPASPEVRYALRLGDAVAGLRLVGNTLELLDAGGAPRLRMAPPYVVDADGRVTWADLSVEDCAVDTLPSIPWGRSPKAPGSRECHVRVAWSGRDVSYPAVLDPEWATTGSLINGRSVFTATLLQDGRVLAAGGYKQGYIAAAEVYDPATGSWAATGFMSQVRGFQTATLLGSGKVLVVGGANYEGYPSETAELYDPATGTWSSTASMPEARHSHAASLLGDGRVLITGGRGISSNPTSALLYDPATGTWSQAGTLTTARYDHTGEVLSDGRVLVIGGMGGPGAQASVELYDPATGTWSLTGAMSTAREGVTSTRLADGRILVAGGNSSKTELYDPASGTWSATGTLPESRASNTAGLLPDGRAYVLGGYITYSSPTQLAGLALYEPLSGTWMTGSAPAVLRKRHQSLLLPDGRLLVIGGETSNTTALSSVELFTPGPRDVTAPLATLTSPTAGATLRDTVTLTADVSDESPITRVSFYDGNTLLNNDFTAPYSVSWNTRYSANGTHVLTVKAYDAAGFVGTSSTVTVTLDNDLTPPTTAITSPATGSSVQGTVTYSADASDANGVTRVDFLVNGSYIGSDSTPPYSVSWNTLSLSNGSYTLVARAYDAAGNAGGSPSVTVTVNNPLPPFGYDSALKAPRCSDARASCDSGTLLNGRGPLGPEPNQPNAVNGSCSDGAAGVYHQDESLDRLAVSTLDGTNLAAGKTVRIDATVWAYASYTSDYLDLYYAPDASAPSWSFIGTLPAAASGAHVLSKTYTLPSATSRAVVRGIFRYGGSARSCPGGSYTDVDDLVFNAQ